MEREAFLHELVGFEDKFDLVIRGDLGAGEHRGTDDSGAYATVEAADAADEAIAFAINVGEGNKGVAVRRSAGWSHCLHSNCPRPTLKCQYPCSTTVTPVLYPI